MVNNTFADEYGNTYQSPYIPSKIVGFSGIDPSMVSTGTNSTSGDDVTYEQGTIINNNSNGHTYSEGEDLAIDHEELDNLLGGDMYEHYHLNEADYNTLTEFLAEKRAADEAGETSFALTEEEYERIMQLLDDLYPNWNEDKEQTRYTLNENEYEKLTTLLDAVYSDEDDNNEPTFPTSIDETALNELVNSRIAEYLSNNSVPNNEALTELIDARINANNSAQDEEALNELIDTRISTYFSNNPLEIDNLDVDALTELIDARIETYLRNINASIHSGLEG